MYVRLLYFLADIDENAATWMPDILYKDGDQWRGSASFTREDLPLLAKVADPRPLVSVRAEWFYWPVMVS